MKNWIKRGRPVVLLIAGILIGMLMVGTAIAATIVQGNLVVKGSVTGKAFNYLTTKTGHLSLSPADFAPDSLEGATNDYYNSWGGADISNQEGNRCFNTGVNLPNGSKFKSIKFFYVSDATSDFFGRVVRQKLATGATTDLTDSSPLDDAGTLDSNTRTIPATKQTVNNGTYAYMVGVCPYLGTTFNGAIITFTYKTVGP